jgi:hypothetical protein
LENKKSIPLVFVALSLENDSQVDKQSASEQPKTLRYTNHQRHPSSSRRRHRSPATGMSLGRTQVFPCQDLARNCGRRRTIASVKEKAFLMAIRGMMWGVPRLILSLQFPDGIRYLVYIMYLSGKYGSSNCCLGGIELSARCVSQGALDTIYF